MVGKKITFKHALNGIKYSLETQPSLTVHLSAALAAVCLGFGLKLSLPEWLVLVLTIILVLASEMMNTALESVTDLVTSEYRLQAKIAKDVAAGTVLVTVFGSVIVGVIIFLPKLLDLF